MGFLYRTFLLCCQRRNADEAEQLFGKLSLRILLWPLNEWYNGCVPTPPTMQLSILCMEALQR